MLTLKLFFFILQFQYKKYKENGKIIEQKDYGYVVILSHLAMSEITVSFITPQEIIFRHGQTKQLSYIK